MFSRDKNYLLKALSNFKNLKVLVDLDNFDASLWVVLMLKFHPNFNIDQVQNAGCPLISEQIMREELHLPNIFSKLEELHIIKPTSVRLGSFVVEAMIGTEINVLISKIEKDYKKLDRRNVQFIQSCDKELYDELFVQKINQGRLMVNELIVHLLLRSSKGGINFLLGLLTGSAFDLS